MSRAAAVVMAVLALSPRAAMAQAPPAHAWYRVYLTDGRALSSFGEWAHVDDRVVFSMPTAGGGVSADLQLVAIPAARVDWTRTNQYAASVRAAAYASSRGEADFAALSAQVAATLNDVAAIADAGVRLATAERARQTLSAWPAAHHGYKAAEVQAMLGTLDGIIAALGAAVGQTTFALSLSASVVAAPPPPLPPPTDADIVDGLQAAASLAESAVERLTLLQRVLALLDRAIGTLPAEWAARVRRAVLDEVAETERVDRAYAALRTSALLDAAKAARRGDLKALARIRARVDAEDARLGRRQPGEVAALLATLDVDVQAAASVREAQAAWKKRAPSYRRYRRATNGAFREFQSATAALAQVKQMSGPPVAAIGKLSARLAKAGRTLAKVDPPDDLAASHALAQSAWELATSALRLRLEAVADNSLDGARQASSAAAGALMLYARAADDRRAVMEPPARR